MILKEFVFKIYPLPPSFSVLGLKYISAELNKDYSTIFLNGKFDSERLFISESKYFLNTFFSMFFNEYPDLKVDYSDISIFKNGEEIKDTESCDIVSKKCDNNIIDVKFV